MSDVGARKRRGLRGWIVALSVTTALTLVAAGLAVAGVITMPGTAEAAPESGETFVFVAADDVGEDPFSETPLATPPNPALVTPASSKASTAAEAAAVLAQTPTGRTPGLYGGTQNNGKCDPAQLVSFLASNPSKAAAWVAALNADPDLRWGNNDKLTVAEIPAYVSNLIVSTLRSDTLVTNHGFIDGQANPLQSVLQAGTAVLVDRFGTPRVRCYCGNPLIPPQTPNVPNTTPPPTAQTPPPTTTEQTPPPCIEVPDSDTTCPPSDSTPPTPPPSYLDLCAKESFDEDCESGPHERVFAPACADTPDACPPPGPSASTPPPPATPVAPPAAPDTPAEFEPVPPTAQQCTPEVDENTPMSRHALINNSAVIIDVWVWDVNCTITQNFRVRPGDTGAWIEGTPGAEFSITSGSSETLMVIQINPDAGDYVFG